MIFMNVCHRPDGLEVLLRSDPAQSCVCHRPDGLEDSQNGQPFSLKVCHRPDGLEEATQLYVLQQ